jgi:hypothetical protein
MGDTTGLVAVVHKPVASEAEVKTAVKLPDHLSTVRSVAARARDICGVGPQSVSMDDRVERFIRSKFRSAGERYGETARAYREGREIGDLPEDDEGRARIVCRRHAERRAVAIDGEGKPACFDPDHVDCRGCAEDVREGRVETW